MFENLSEWSFLHFSMHKHKNNVRDRLSWVGSKRNPNKFISLSRYITVSVMWLKLKEKRKPMSGLWNLKSNGLCALYYILVEKVRDSLEVPMKIASQVTWPKRLRARSLLAYALPSFTIHYFVHTSFKKPMKAKVHAVEKGKPCVFGTACTPNITHFRVPFLCLFFLSEPKYFHFLKSMKITRYLKLLEKKKKSIHYWFALWYSGFRD